MEGVENTPPSPTPAKKAGAISTGLRNDKTVGDGNVQCQHRAQRQRQR